MSEPTPENKILTLSQLTAGIAKVISEHFPYAFWVKAELAKLNHYPESGHCYPALVEKDKGVVRAEMRGTIWANDFLRINRRFLQVTREPLKEGIHILFRALVKYHPVYGLSLQINDIDPSYTLGEMAREKLETINRLKKEGLFDLNRQVSMPVLPQRVAIISVKTSKGYSDFISILENNAWGYAFSTALFPALLQGDKAVESILGQLREIRKRQADFDVVAIIRGGGGDVGLNCYDHYALASEVAQFPLPVLSGIGHSTNETVVEMVAGHNKITPTDVAYFLIQQFHNFAALVEEYQRKIIEFSREMLEGETKAREDMVRRFVSGTRQFLQEESSGLGIVSRDLSSLVRQSLHQERIRMRDIESKFEIRPLQVVMDASNRLRQKWLMLQMLVRQTMHHQSFHLDQIDHQIRLLDPVNILRRGFSITYVSGRILRDQAEVKVGDEVETQLFSGKLTSEIKSKSE